MRAVKATGRLRARGRMLFVVAVTVWVFAAGGWIWVYWQMQAAAQDDAACPVLVGGDPYTEFTGQAEWQSAPQPGILCRYEAQMRGQNVEIIELRPVSLSAAGLLVLWGATLVVLRPRADGRAP
jgi:hypothetical protein